MMRFDFYEEQFVNIVANWTQCCYNEGALIAKVMPFV